MVILYVLLVLIVVFAVNYVVATKMENAAALKGYGKDVNAFAMCFWLGIIGCVYVAALPDKIQQQQNQKMIELLENKENEKM